MEKLSQMERKNEQGFTLLELLLVLSIVLLLSAISLPVGQKIAQKKVDKKAMQWIVGLIHTTQSLAIGNKEAVYITFYSNTYRIRSSSPVTNERLEVMRGNYPEGIRYHGNGQHEYLFSPSGNISRPGTSTFTTKSGTFSLKVQMARGRVIING